MGGRTLRGRRATALLTGLLLIAALLHASPARAAARTGSIPSPTPTSTPIPDPGSGPPPVPIPDDKREPARPPSPEVDMVQPPDFAELYGDSDSPQDFLESLEENVEVATEVGSTYKVHQLGEGDHLTDLTIDPQNFLNDQGQWQKIDTSLVHQSQGPQQVPGSQMGSSRAAPGSSIGGRSGSGPSPQDCTQGGWTNQAGPIQVFFPEQVACLPLSFTMEEGTLLVTPLEVNGQVTGTMQDTS